MLSGFCIIWILTELNVIQFTDASLGQSTSRQFVYDKAGCSLLNFLGGNNFVLDLILVVSNFVLIFERAQICLKADNPCRIHVFALSVRRWFEQWFSKNDFYWTKHLVSFLSGKRKASSFLCCLSGFPNRRKLLSKEKFFMSNVLFQTPKILFIFCRLKYKKNLI